MENDETVGKAEAAMHAHTIAGPDGALALNGEQPGEGEQLRSLLFGRASAPEKNGIQHR